jgi:hypothetical protein
MLVIKRYASPLFTAIQLLNVAAPVFRRACTEPSDRLINLPRLLLSAELNLRHFAATDVMLNFTLARPMYFRYDVSCTPEIRKQLIEGASGLQWLYGVPDQVMILLAWISGLYEDSGSSVDPKFVAQIEYEVKNMSIMPNPPADPALTVRRLVVHECWRQTLYIFLYVVSMVVFGVSLSN